MLPRSFSLLGGVVPPWLFGLPSPLLGIASAEVLCVLSELWDSKSGNRSDLHEVRVLDEEQCSEVQGDDADDEPGRRSRSWWSTSRSSWRAPSGGSHRSPAREQRERSAVASRKRCAERGRCAGCSEPVEGHDRRRRAANGGWCAGSRSRGSGHGPLRGASAAARFRCAASTRRAPSAGRSPPVRLGSSGEPARRDGRVRRQHAGVQR
jgi:hypothetical protein